MRLTRSSRTVASAAVLVLTLVGGLSAASYAQSGNANPMHVLVTNDADQPVPVAGAVAVSNLPATQHVDGTVTVDNLPATQDVQGRVTVENLPTSFDGTVRIDPTANTVRLHPDSVPPGGVDRPTAVVADGSANLDTDTVISVVDDVDVSGYDVLRIYGRTSDGSYLGDPCADTTFTVWTEGWRVATFPCADGSVVLDTVGGRVTVTASYTGYIAFQTVTVMVVGSAR